MDQAQYQLLLSAVAISANPMISSKPEDKQQAFTLLSQFKESNNAAQAAFYLLERAELHQYGNQDYTIQVHLYALQTLLSTLSKHYSSLNQSDRHTFRSRLLSLISKTLPSQQVTIPKLASLLSDVILRDFPQRWTSLLDDLMSLFTTSSSAAQIVLNAVTIVTEDCTDSDFNSKVATARRNDVLQGLNEISSRFLPTVYQFLQHHYNSLLSPNQQSASPEESIKTLITALNMLHKFCIWMPLDWAYSPSHDFVSVFLHLLRESRGEINVLSATCLDSLCSRKLTPELYSHLLQALPQSIADANAHLPTNTIEMLSNLLPYHSKISSALAHLLAFNVAKITDDKTITHPSTPPSNSHTILSTYLRLMVELTLHPSPIVAAMQLNTWILLCRDPQISRSPLLKPYSQTLLQQYLRVVKHLNWDAVDDGSDPLAPLYDESWCDVEDYENWLNNCRGLIGTLCRLLSSVDPVNCSAFLLSSVTSVLASHGNPPQAPEITSKSPSYIEIEALTTFFDNIVHTCSSASKPPNTSLSSLCSIVVEWSPASSSQLLLRRIIFLESLRHYLKIDSTTLPAAIESLLSTLSFRDSSCPAPVPITHVDQLQPNSIVLRRRSGMALVAIGKICAEVLVPHISQLANKSIELLNSSTLLPPQKQHLIEFLTCVANAIPDQSNKSTFITSMLQESLNYFGTHDFQALTTSTDNFLAAMGILNASASSVTDPAVVNPISTQYSKLFSSLNQLLSVAKRCNESSNPCAQREIAGFEGPVSLADLAAIDPFVHHWLTLLPVILSILTTTTRIFLPEIRAHLLSDPIARFALAVSDEEAIVATKKFTATSNPMEEVELHGFVIKNTNKRKCNLAPRWPGWLNELRNTPLQMLGLLASSRSLFSPEFSPHYQSFVDFFSPANLKIMEHRHMIAVIKQFTESFMVNCPSQLYVTHLTPVLAPLFEHLRWRLASTWRISAEGKVGSMAPNSITATSAAEECRTGGGSDEWFEKYYSYGGLFVGDVEAVDNEALVDKMRIDLSHSWADCLQTALALRGDWALTLANIAKEQDSTKKGKKQDRIPPNSKSGMNAQSHNADGTARTADHKIIEARHLTRIDALAHYLLTEQSVAGPIVQTIFTCLAVPDAHTCRRAVKICHRILENCAHLPMYENILSDMFKVCINNIVQEQKWMVGCEWDYIALARDFYCRLVLGQALTPGGQGPGQQCQLDGGIFIQFKTAEVPRDGGGILCRPSDQPRHYLASLPGSSVAKVKDLENMMNNKRSAKDQKGALRDFLLVVANVVKLGENTANLSDGVFARASENESVLNREGKKSDIEAIQDENGVMASLKKKKKAAAKAKQVDVTDAAASLFG